MTDVLLLIEMALGAVNPSCFVWYCLFLPIDSPLSLLLLLLWLLVVGRWGTAAESST